MEQNNIFIQDGKYITVLHQGVAKAGIYSEEQRRQIKELIRNDFYPHHTAIGVGKATNKHWSLESYKGRIGEGYKMITTSPFSSNFNHITYFIKY